MLRTMCVLVAALVLGTASLFAQTTTGTLRGTVRDTSGAVLPGATVEADRRRRHSDRRGRRQRPVSLPGADARRLYAQGHARWIQGHRDGRTAGRSRTHLRRRPAPRSRRGRGNGHRQRRKPAHRHVTVRGHGQLQPGADSGHAGPALLGLRLLPDDAGDRLDAGAGLHDLLGLRVEHQRKPVPDRRHQHHVAHGRADVALSEHRHRRRDGVGWRRRARRIRQHAGRGVQHRHQERRQRDERLVQLVQPVPGHHRQQSA